MKHSILRKLMLIAVLLTGSHAFAHDFEVDGIYYNIVNLSELTCEVTYKSTNYGSYSGDIKIPEIVTYKEKKLTVTSIGSSAFRGCSSLTSVTIPNSVTSIGYSAFDTCSSLTSVTIGNSVTSIGYSAFDTCSSLTSVTIPNSVTSIGYSAFDGCKSLKYLKFEDGNSILTLSTNYTHPGGKIGEGLFYDCPIETLHLGRNISYDTNLESGYSPFYKTTIKDITIGDSVSMIDEYMFCGCKNLSSIIIPSSITTIGNYAFSGCSSLKELNIEDGKNTLSLGYNPYIFNYDGYKLDYSSGLFNNCPIETIYLGRNISYREPPFYDAYDDNTTLCLVTIGNYVTEIGIQAFVECKKLNSVTIGNSVKNICDEAFYGCSNLASIIIPDSVTRIGKWAFSDCSGLTSVAIGNSVTNTEYKAFCGCGNLTSITIGKSLKEFGNETFLGCPLITQINSLNPIPPTKVSFDNKVYINATVKVPIGTLSAYQSAVGWKDFWDISESDFSSVESTLADDVNVLVENGNIVISGADNANVEVYNVNGQCVYNGTSTTISVAAKGLYIVKVNNKSFKVIL